MGPVTPPDFPDTVRWPLLYHGVVITLRDRLLGLPIIYKVLIANTGIVALGAVGGTWLTIAVARGSLAEIVEILPPAREHQ